jgi:cytochrome c553
MRKPILGFLILVLLVAACGGGNGDEEKAARPGSRVSGQLDETYLRESIKNADAFTVDGFTADVMPAALGDDLSEQQLADLVAYLLTRE